MSNTLQILLFGSSGQLGWELQRSLAPLGEITALDANSAAFCGDFSQPHALRETVRKLRPDVIVNAAAYTAVDKAQSEPDCARTINAEAPGVLAEEAQRIGAWMVHYSTDYIFDGSKPTPWVESDAPVPLNVYGQTKLEGESLVRSACDKHLILRTSWVYAAHGVNFVKTMLKLAQERDRLKVVNDQIGAPTGADLLADVTAHALRSVLHNAQRGGLYHVTAQGSISWYGYAQFVIEHARVLGLPVKVQANAIEPVGSDSYLVAARRPLNSRLDTSLFQQTFGLNLPPWQPGVARMIEELLRRN